MNPRVDNLQFLLACLFIYGENYGGDFHVEGEVVF
jgi:hypothetical protein